MNIAVYTCNFIIFYQSEAASFKNKYLPLTLFYIFIGVGLLAKGLIGFVLPAWIIVPWLLWHRRWAQLLRLLHPLGLIAAAAVAAPWFMAMQARYPGFYDYFFMEQHVRQLLHSHHTLAVAVQIPRRYQRQEILPAQI